MNSNVRQKVVIVLEIGLFDGLNTYITHKQNGGSKDLEPTLEE